MGRKRKGRKKEVAAEEPSKPVKKRGRPKKKALCEHDDVLALSSEPEPLPYVPEKKQAKEAKPRGRGKKKAPCPEALKVESTPAPKTAPVPAADAKQVPPEDSEILQDHNRGDSIKKMKPSRRETYFVADALASEEDDLDSHLIDAEPKLDLLPLDRTVVKEIKPALQRKRPVPRRDQSPKLLDGKMAHSPGAVQGKGAMSPKKAKKTRTQRSPSLIQMEVAQAMEQPISGVPFLKLFESICFDDSREAAREMFSMLIHPVSEEHFLS